MRVDLRRAVRRRETAAARDRHGPGAARFGSRRRLRDLPRLVAARLGYCGGASASLTRSAKPRRTSRILALARVGFTRLVSRIMNTPRSGSNQMDVPVKPVCPNAFGPIFVPALESSDGVSQPSARDEPGGMSCFVVNR